MRCFIVLFFVFGYQLVQAQDRYAEGTVVTFSGDTLQKKIRVVNKKKLKKVVYLDERNKRKRFSAKNVKMYAINGLVTYVSIAPRHRSSQRRYFARVLEDGPLQLLYYEYTKRYYVQNRGALDAEKITKFKFRKGISKYLKYNQELSHEVRKRRLRYEDIALVVKKYNQWYADFYLPYVNDRQVSNQ